MIKTRIKPLFYMEVFIIAAALFLSGSSFAAPMRAYTGPELPESQTALVKGADMTINLVSCDGVKVTSLSFSVLPGKHTIEMSYSGGGSYPSDTSFLEVNAEAGHIYVVDQESTSSQPGRYTAFIIDKTTGKRVSTPVIPQSTLERRLTVAEKSIKEHSQNADFWLGKADVLIRMKRYEEALPAIETALSLKPDLGGAAWNSKSFILYQLGRYDEALADIEKAIKLRGNDNDKKGKETVLKKIEERKKTTEK